MTTTEILKAALCKIAAEQTESALLKSMQDRVGGWHTEESEPKGLPEQPVNQDETVAEDPTKHTLPKGVGYSNSVTGTGHGKSLGKYGNY